MNHLFQRRFGIVPLVAIALFWLANGLGVRLQVAKSVNKVASKIPEQWKKDPATGKPRACGVIEKTVGLATRIVLLGGGGGGKSSQQENSTSAKSTVVEVDADSNRSALGGNLSKLSITVRNSKSPLGLLEVESFSVEGSDLKLGLSPLVTTAGVPIILLVPPVRQTVWTISLSYYLWNVARRLAKKTAANSGSAATASSIEQSMKTTEFFVNGWRKRIMGGSPSQLSFEMVLSNENVENSFLLMQSSKLLLRFLMRNSVLQTAAIVGDAVNDSAIQSQIPKSPPQKTNLISDASGKLTRINQEQQVSQSPFDSTRESPKNKLSRLLSATAFELREAPTFRPEDGKNHLQFVSVAILPEDQARLDFVLRTTLVAGKNRGFLLQLVQPECRFDVKEATSSLPLPRVVSELLPKVLWLPIGPGVSIGDDDKRSSTGGGLSIREISVVPEGKCKIGGNILLLPESPSGGLVRLHR